MKRSLVVILVVFLTACETPPIDLRDEIVSAMSENDNFIVQEDFRWQQFARREDRPFNVDIISTNVINFQENRYLIDHFIDEQRNNDGEQTRTLFQGSSYKNIFNQQAAIRVDRDWLAVQLRQINQMGLGSIDPVDLVNQLLYQSTDLYYKSEEGVTGSFEDYRFAVVTLDKELFEQLFVHSIGSIVQIPYSYRVFVELEFDENFKIISITADLSDLLRQYRDYYEVQQGFTFTVLDASYELVYQNYGDVRLTPPTASAQLFVDGRVILNTDNAVVTSRTSRIRWNQEPNITERINMLKLDVTPLEPLRLVVYEVVVEADPLRLVSEQAYVFPGLATKTLLEIPLPTSDVTYYVVIRGITATQGRVVSEIVRLDYQPTASNSR